VRVSCVCVYHLQILFFLSLSLCHDTCTSTQEDVGSSEEKFIDEEDKEPEKNVVSEENIWSLVGQFQVPQHHKITPLSILGSDQQNLQKNSQTSSGLGIG